MDFSTNLEELPAERDLNLEKRILDVVREQYRHGCLLQKYGYYKEAFCAYKVLTSLVATEPLLWVRLTECCLAALYNYLRKRGTGELASIELSPNRISKLYIIDDFKHVAVEDGADFAESEISLEFAEMAIAAANTLVRSSKNVHLTKRVKALICCVAIKKARFRQANVAAQELIDLANSEQANKPMKKPTNPGEKRDKGGKNGEGFDVDDYLLAYAGLIKVECMLRRGYFEESYNNLCRLKLKDGKERGIMMVKYIMLYEKCVALCGQDKWNEAKKVYLELVGYTFPSELVALGCYIFTHLGEFDQFRDLYQRRKGERGTRAPPNTRDASPENPEKSKIVPANRNPASHARIPFGYSTAHPCNR